MTTGQMIKNYRKSAGMTQSELASKLGYRIPQFISLIENGHSKFPLAQGKQLARALRLNQKNKTLIVKNLVKEYRDDVKKNFGV